MISISLNLRRLQSQLVLFFFLCYFLLRREGFYYFKIYVFGCPRSQLHHAGSFLVDSLVVVHGLSCSLACGILVLTRDPTHIPWIARKILNHCTTREVPPSFFIEEGSSNMNGPTDGHTKWSKPDRERLVPYDITYVWDSNLGNGKESWHYKQSQMY